MICGNEWLGSSHTIQPLRTTETLSTASSTDVAAPSEIESPAIPAAMEPSAPHEATTSAGRTRKCIRPITARERMEKKIDAMIEKKDAIITHLKDMKEMMKQHHSEHTSGFDRLINVISDQGKAQSLRISIPRIYSPKGARRRLCTN